MKMIALVLILTVLPLQAAGNDRPANIDPFKLYPNGLTFDVLRNGDIVGQHTVRFGREMNGTVRVFSSMKLDVSLLFVTVYSYAYTSEGVWRDGVLASLTATQDDDGTVSSVSVETSASGLQITGPNGSQISNGPLFPTNHWHPGVIGSTRVIDTLTGEVADVSITDAGLETISAQGREIAARKFVYAGDIETTVWYDEAGRWTGMMFKAKGGSEITYRCKECGIPDGGANG